MGEEDILRLCRQRRIPPPTKVECRASGDEVEPAPRPGEVVVFYAHFTCSFGLPASLFFHAFCEFFRLQPHHLGANVVLGLTSFVSYCKAYAGVWPTVDLWAKFFHLKVQRGVAQVPGDVRVRGRLDLCPEERWLPEGSSSGLVEEVAADVLLHEEH
jgi:hypothetical protein